MTNPCDNGITVCDAQCFEQIHEQVQEQFTIVDGIYRFKSSLGVVIPPTLQASRFLDYFYIVFDPLRPGSDLAPERVLFDLIASEYELDVDKPNNVRTADALIQMVNASRIVDFGCGTGLALQAPSAGQRKLLGLDASNSMLAIALQAGMDAFHVSQVGSLSVPRFDGLISCYALHLHGPRLSLGSAIDLLSDKARVAANFHKGLGFDEVAESLAAHGFTVVKGLHRIEGLPSPIALWERGR